eukprot:1731334-Pyramimonas_sp.AAC.1
MESRRVPMVTVALRPPLRTSTYACDWKRCAHGRSDPQASFGIHKDFLGVPGGPRILYRADMPCMGSYTEPTRPL